MLLRPFLINLPPPPPPLSFPPTHYVTRCSPMGVTIVAWMTIPCANSCMGCVEAKVTATGSHHVDPDVSLAEEETNMAAADELPPDDKCDTCAVTESPLLTTTRRSSCPRASTYVKEEEKKKEK